MIDIPNSPTNGSTVTLGTKKYMYTDGMLTPFFIKQVGTELPDYKIGVEVLTTERWVDGKPLYRKVINFGVLGNTVTKSVSHGAESVSEIWVDRSLSKVVNPAFVGVSWGVDFPNSVAGSIWNCTANNTNINIQTNTDRTAFSAIVTILYTKTTDTASSPVATLYPRRKLPIFSAVTNLLTTNGILSFTTILVDTVSMATSNSVIIPENGIYEMSISGNIDTIGQLLINKNGVVIHNGYENDDRASIGIQVISNLVVGDVVTFTYSEIQTAGAMLNAAYCSIKFISDSSGWI